MNRAVALVSLLAVTACGTESMGTGDDGGEIEPIAQTFDFGPFELAGGAERTNTCVSASLNNDEPIFINRVELTTDSGFHHSNWFYVKDSAFAGPDGIWDCDERAYDEFSAAAYGGVLFAQSTQNDHEIQQFDPGVAIRVPAHAKLVAGVHLLNPGDDAITTPLQLTVTPIRESETTVKLTGLSIEYERLAIQPHRQTRFSTTCDFQTAHQSAFGRPLDFNIYYVLPHYHTLGVASSFTAIGPSGEATIFDTTSAIGDQLGGPVSPAFSTAGYDQLRFSCTFDNPGDGVVGWGVGDGEMCVLLAFTDSEWMWGGGIVSPGDPGPAVDHGAVLDYEQPCELITLPPR